MSSKAADALHEADKPMARYRDDEDLDQMLREMDRAEDPMLAYVKKKKTKNAPPVKGFLLLLFLYFKGTRAQTNGLKSTYLKI